MRLTRFFAWYSKEDVRKYSMARCEECGWTGLFRDVLGGSYLGDYDYDDCYCPLCDSVVDEEPADRYWLLWLWRFVSLWMTRRKLRAWLRWRQEAIEQGWCLKCHGCGSTDVAGTKTCRSCNGTGSKP